MLLVLVLIVAQVRIGGEIGDHLGKIARRFTEVHVWQPRLPLYVACVSCLALAALLSYWLFFSVCLLRPLQQVCGLKPGEFVHMMGDTHVYIPQITCAEWHASYADRSRFPVVATAAGVRPQARRRCAHDGRRPRVHTPNAMYGVACFC